MKSALLIPLLFLLNANAKPESIPQNGEAFVVYIENDSRSLGGPGSDQAYSNGIKFSYIYAENRVPEWAEETLNKIQIFKRKANEVQPNYGISLGHQIYTPNNTQAKNLLKNDRPYAGWLYLGFTASFKEEKVGHFLELDLGVVGPAAAGQQVQNSFHRAIGVETAKGWKNQIKNEPTIQLSYQQRFKLLREDNWDVVPYFGGGVGNVLVAGHIGAIIRFGVNLPDDFGPTRPSAADGDMYISPASEEKKSPLGYYVFAGSRGNAVAYNIFLDGNTFTKSHRVNKYPFTFETEFGAGIRYNSYSLIWRFVTRSPEFEERSRFNSFASINFVTLL